MNYFKKAISLLLVLSIFFSLGISAFAETVLVSLNTLSYEVNNDAVSITITGCPKNIGSEITIQQTIDGYTVTAIGDEAFRNCTKLSFVSIPDSVTYIGEKAFSGCSGLKKVKFGTGLVTIGKEAFTYCESLVSIDMPNSVKELGQNAFLGCKALTSASISGGIRILDSSSAFNECSSLETVIVKEGVEEIGYEKQESDNNTNTSVNRKATFYKCYNLQDLYIPHSMKKINFGAFQECGKINYIHYNGDSLEWRKIQIDAQILNYLSSSHATVASIPFLDVKFEDYFYTAIEWALGNGITTGTSHTSFSPNDICTRAQIITFIWRAAGYPQPNKITSKLDISSDSYYYKAVLWAMEKLILNSSISSLNDPCTRAMVVEYLWKYAGSPVTKTVGCFTDVNKNDSCAQAVAWALKNGITSGTSATTFSPNSLCTRSQIVTFLYRAYEANLFPNLLPPPTTVKHGTIINYKGNSYSLTTKAIKNGTKNSINISEWHPLMGITKTMLAPADGVDETQGDNPVVYKTVDAMALVTNFIQNSHEITNLNVVTNSKNEMNIQYGDPIELSKSGKKTSLSNLIIQKYSGAYPSILFTADKKADELLREWFGFNGVGQYSMEIEFGRVNVGDCGYCLMIENGKIYQLPVFNEGTKLNIYYKEGSKTNFLFDAVDVIRFIKMEMPEDEANKVLKQLSENGYVVQK